jgi:hypothetical protein
MTGGGGAVLLTTGAFAIAVASALAAPYPAGCFAGAERGTLLYVLVKTGSGLVTAPRALRWTTLLVVLVVLVVLRVRDGTAREGTVWAAAAGGAGFSFGSAICGNRATGTDSAGSGAGSACARSSAWIAATIAPAYGSISATIPTMLNQNRCRREPSPVNPRLCRWRWP